MSQDQGKGLMSAEIAINLAIKIEDAHWETNHPMTVGELQDYAREIILEALDQAIASTEERMKGEICDHPKTCEEWENVQGEIRGLKETLSKKEVEIDRLKSMLEGECEDADCIYEDKYNKSQDKLSSYRTGLEKAVYIIKKSTDPGNFSGHGWAYLQQDLKEALHYLNNILARQSEKEQ